MRRSAIPAVLVGAIALLCFLAYAPVRRARFLQDDHPIVQQNPIVHRGSLIEIFSTDYWGGVGGSETSLYRPVTILSFALERGAGGRVDAARAHLVNVALHALVSLALVALAIRIGVGRGRASLAGALFALHPVHVSVVAGLVGRAEILAALFTLVALLLQSAASGGAMRERLASWGAGVAVFLALGSKEVALAAPLLLVFLELSFRPPSPARMAHDLLQRGAALAPTALAVAVYAALRLRALGVFPAVQRPRLSENILVGLEGAERLATALGLAARYVGLLVAPVRLSADYSGGVIRSERSLLAPLPLAGAACLLLLLALAIAPAVSSRARAWRVPSFAALLFLLPYLTIGNLFVLVGIGFAERLVYLPSVGFCLLLGLVLGRLAALDGAAHASNLRRIASTILLAALLVTAGVLTHRATYDWQTDTTIFEAALRATPQSPRVQFTLGKIRLDQGRPDEALRFFTRTTEVWPPHSAAWYEKGRLEAARGDRAAAIKSLREALRLSPSLADAAAALADLLFEEQRYEEAARFYARAARAGRSDVLPKLRESRSRARVSPAELP